MGNRSETREILHKSDHATVGARIAGDQAVIARDPGSYRASLAAVRPGSGMFRRAYACLETFSSRIGNRQFGRMKWQV